MPQYLWRCFAHPKNTLSVFGSVTDKRTDPPCPECGELMDRDYQAEHSSRPATALGFPFVTTHFDGTPVEVRDAGHLRDLCKTHGVRLRDDAGWVETESRVEHYTDLNGIPRARVVYQEGRGDGESGRRWI